VLATLAHARPGVIVRMHDSCDPELSTATAPAARIRCLTGRMIILSGGRVVDPGTQLDGTYDVGIENGTITAVAPVLHPTEHDTVVDVSGCVVGPGFVDLHSHVHTVAGQRLQAMDGVTTALDLEAGLMPISLAYERAAKQGRPLNYGFSASWGSARAQILLGVQPDATFASAMNDLADPRWQRSSSAPELSGWLSLLERELADGALGIGVLMGYAPQTDPAEFMAVARLAAAANAPTYTHVRELVEADPDIPIDGSSEIAIAAAETGAAMHHCHVNSTSRRHVERVLATLDKARTDGARVTVETYPYGAGSTAVGAYFLAPDRLDRWGLTPSSITMVGSGERLTDLASLRAAQAADPAADCIVEFLDESDPADLALLHRTLAFPDSIVGSDAMPILWDGHERDTYEWPLPPGGRTHPRSTGTFSKAIRLMVRDTAAWTWLEAFRRCSYLPARVIDEVAPAARAKGHLGVGADADVVVLDPTVISDAATYLDPTRPSRGVRQLLVGGTFVVRDGELVTDAFPGRPVRGEPA
jgi:cytosine/adenosine deaminase-related metal-dependent hydrolase